MVLIAAQTITNWKYGGTTAKLRIFSTAQFTPFGGGGVVMPGVVSRKDSCHIEINCTVSGNTLTVPAIPNLPSTVSSSNPRAAFVFIFYDSRDTQRDYFTVRKSGQNSGELKIPPSPTSTNFTQIFAYNQTSIAPVPASAYTKAEINALLADLPSPDLPFASESVFGTSKSSKAPLTSGTPVHVETSESSFLAAKESLYLADFKTSSNSYADAVNEAIAAADGEAKDFIYNETIEFTGNFTVPANLTFKPGNAGILRPRNGSVVTLRSFDGASNRKYFDTSGGEVVLDKNAVELIKLSYWTGSNPSQDNTREVNQMLKSLDRNDGGTAYAGRGEWRIKNTIPIVNACIIRGEGVHPDGTAAPAATTFVVIPPDPSDIAAPKSYGFTVVGNSRNIVFRDCCVASNAPVSTVGVLVTGSTPNTIIGVKLQNVGFSGLERGLDIRSTSANGQPPIQVAQVVASGCYWIGCIESVRCNTNNALLRVDDFYMNINAGCTGFNLINSGIVAVRDGEFAGVGVPNGVPYYTGNAGLAQDQPNPTVFGNSTVFKIGGQFVSVSIESCQDEGIAKFLEVNVPYLSGVISLNSNLIQSRVQLNQNCLIHSTGNTYNGCNIYRDAPGVSAFVVSRSDTWALNGAGEVGIHGVNGGVISATLAQLDRFVGFSKLDGDRVLNSEQLLRRYHRQYIPTGGDLMRAGRFVATSEFGRVIDDPTLVDNSGNALLLNGEDVRYPTSFANDFWLEYFAPTDAGRRFRHAVEITETLQVSGAANLDGNVTVGGLLNGNNAVFAGIVDSFASETQSLKIGENGTPKSSERSGLTTLVAGAKTVVDATVTANSRIYIDRHTDGGTVAASYSKTRNPGVGFTIQAKDGAGANQNGDTSVVYYTIIES